MSGIQCIEKFNILHLKISACDPVLIFLKIKIIKETVCIKSCHIQYSCFFDEAKLRQIFESAKKLLKKHLKYYFFEKSPLILL